MYKPSPVKTALSLPILTENMPKEMFSLPAELLNISDIRITGTDFNHNGNVIIDIESIHSETTCHQCGNTSYSVRIFLSVIDFFDAENVTLVALVIYTS